MNQLTMRAVRDAGGFIRHVPMTFAPAPAPRGRKARPAPDPIKTNGESAAEQLRLFVERVERMDEEIKGLRDDRADILAEAKATGFDVKALLTIVDERRKDRNALLEQQAILETYKINLGLI